MTSISALDERRKCTVELASLMEKNGLHALLVPSEDAHQTEMVANKDKRREWISGFTGSAGIALICLDKSNEFGVKCDLWTDGRYFIQAEVELDSTFWKLRKMGEPGVPKLSERLVEVGSKVKGNLVVGIDTRHVTFTTLDRWKSQLESFDVSFKDATGLIDQVRNYQESQQVLNSQSVFPHPIEYSGETVESKVGRLRAFLTNEYKVEGKFALVSSDLSEVCWLTNLRGRNIVDYCPLFFGFCILTEQSLILCSDLPDGSENQTQALEKYLTSLKASVNLQVFTYQEFETILEKEAKERHVFLPTSTSQKVFAVCEANATKVEIEKHGILSLYKAQKNEREVAGMRESHVVDSVAMIRYLHWLENNVTPTCGIDEVDAADVLEQFRSEGEGFAGLSFETISSYGSNGAVIHYSPAKGNNQLKTLKTDSLYLVDSGGQYLSGGTTDITRTIIVGNPTADMKKYFTLVLEGHISFANHTITPGTTLKVLDGLARGPLMEHNANYGHGTSHGVGTYLNVHELPVGYATDVIEEGMCFSNEPGFYRESHWGIRIETVVVAVKDGDSGNLKLETLNYVPVQRKLIDVQFLSETSRKWLNDYHRDVYAKMAPILEAKGLNEERQWLQDATKPI